jgi:hypothetical protein
LKRELTSEDGRQGTAVRANRAEAGLDPAPQAPLSVSAAPSVATWYLPALGLLTAAGIVAADLWWRRRATTRRVP